MWWPREDHRENSSLTWRTWWYCVPGTTVKPTSSPILAACLRGIWHAEWQAEEIVQWRCMDCALWGVGAKARLTVMRLGDNLHNKFAD